jgi:hypothetical protein
MILVGALAGLLSGFVWMVPNGLMGGALGMSLAAGAIWLGRREQKQGAKPARRQIILAGLVSGLIGGLLMAAISQAFAGRIRGEDEEMFGPPVLPFWAPLVMGILYGLVIQWGYFVRRYSSNPLGYALLSTCLGCFLLKMFATFFYVVVTANGSGWDGILAGSMMYSLVSAAPFALLWVLGMALADPAWRPPAAGSPPAAP